MDTSTTDPTALAQYKLDLARRIVSRLTSGHDRAVNLALQAAELFDATGNAPAAEEALGFAAKVEADLDRRWQQRR